MKRLFEFLAVTMLLAAPLATAQDSLRNSMAGDAAAAASSQQQMSQNYTYKMGDFRLLVAPSMEVDWNDNVLITKTNTLSDFVLMPSLQLTGSYPLTQRNLLNLTVGVGYLEYLKDSTNNRLTITSGSQLSFDTYIKDFLINFHDRFSLIDNSSSEATVAGTASYGSFMNSAGLTTTWDLEDVVLTLGYDHLNTLSSSTEFNYLDHSSELPLARAGLRLRPDLTAGVEITASYTTYDHAVLNNNESYSAGLYADWNPGPSIHIQPRAGYTIYDFQQTSQAAQVSQAAQALYFGTPPASALAAEPIRTQNLSSYYADLTVTHQISKAINYGFSAGHEIRLGIESDTVEDYYFRPNINWSIVRDVTLTTTMFYERGNQGEGNITGNLVESYNYYGGGLSASYQLMKKLALSLTYRLTLRSSNIYDRNYSQDIVGLRLTYQL